MEQKEYDTLCNQLIEKLIKSNHEYQKDISSNKQHKLKDLETLRKEFTDLVSSFHPIQTPIIMSYP